MLPLSHLQGTDMKQRNFLCSGFNEFQLALLWITRLINCSPLLCYCADFQEPYAVVVLLEKDLVVIDLAQNG